MSGSSTFRASLTRFASRIGFSMAVIFGTLSTASAQVNILTPDTTLCGNTAGSITLNAAIGNGGSAFNASTDDRYSQVVDLGFPFTFYGNTYTQCLISTNGYLTFDLSDAGLFSPFNIPAAGGIPGNGNVANSVMGVYADLYPNAGNIEFSTQGMAPNRHFVVTYCSVPFYNCTNLIATFQIVLFETSNNIEVHIDTTTFCSAHNSGAAIEGVQNASASAAVVVPGRNYPGTWTASNSAHRFTPSGNTYQLTPIPLAFFPSGINNITWYENGITQVGSGPSVTVTPTAPSTEYVARTIGCLNVTSADTVTVGVGPFLPVPGVVTPQIYCQGATAPPLSATLFPGATALWYDSAVGGAPLAAVPVINTGTPYRDTFYVLQTTGGCSSQRAQVIVEVRPQPIAELAPERDSICLEETALIGFTGYAPDGSTFFWDFGNGTLLNGPATGIGPYIVQYATPGLYNVGVVVTAPGGCNDAATTQVYVKEKPVASLDILLPDACAGDVRTVRHTVPDVSGNFQFIWDFDGGEIVSGTEGGPYQIRWFDPGTKRVRLIVVKDGCYSEAAFDSINVYPQPVARIIAPSDRSVCIGDTLNLEAEVSGNVGDVYRWYPASWFIPANYINNTNEATFRIPTSGYATLQVLSRYGCEDRDSVFFDAGSCCQIFAPTAFSPNGDGKNDYFRLLGTERTRRIVDIQVLNRYGQEVWRSRDGRSGWDGRRGGVPQESGVYFYHVQYECPDGKVTRTSGDVTLIR